MNKNNSAISMTNVYPSWRTIFDMVCDSLDSLSHSGYRCITIRTEQSKDSNLTDNIGYVCGKNFTRKEKATYTPKTSNMK